MLRAWTTATPTGTLTTPHPPSPPISPHSQGTAALHHRDIVHRDLKPRNVLLTAAPALPAPSRPFRLQAKISDMGLSRKLVPDQSSFETMAPAGSSGWQAPEQLRGREGGGGGAGGGSGEDSSQGMGSGGEFEYEWI